MEAEEVLSIEEALRHAYSRGFEAGQESIRCPICGFKRPGGTDHILFGFAKGRSWDSLTDLELDNYRGFWNNPARDTYYRIGDCRKEIRAEINRRKANTQGRLNKPNTQD